MKQEEIDLAVRRGRLLERISMQRGTLGQQLQPVGDALRTVDRGLAGVRRGRDYLGQHPEIVVAGAAALVVLQPKRLWRWTRRGFFFWRTWRLLRRQLHALGLASPP
ncbi:YqjK-like family protein [Accumulibacter sp.]|uniref:YqjK-like family protein n=1 Tax=Accumulibacter sp. TaxID=2053492 RepID=UPI002631BA38|nr:YqjK-like family protein [Accumulibacter sp.]